MYISLIQLDALLDAIAHYPERSPKRWALIAQYVSGATSAILNALQINIGRLCGRTFQCKAESCKQAYGILQKEGRDDLLSRNLNREKWDAVLRRSESKSALKATVLLPKVDKCLDCEQMLTIRPTCSNPYVYSTRGTTQGAVFSGVCKDCAVTYHVSFYERHPQGEPATRIYYDNCLSDQFLQISTQTVLSVQLIKEIHNQVFIGKMTFESCAELYNENHLHEESGYIGLKREELTEMRIEQAWFIYHLVAFFSDEKCLASVNFNIDTVAGRRDMDTVCEEAYDLIVKGEKLFTKHECNVKGCKEGYVTIDGNEKMKRAMCGSPKSRVLLGKGMPQIVQCCPHSPVFGGKFKVPSKYCEEHMHLESEDSVSRNQPKPKKAKLDYESERPPLIITINLKEFSVTNTIVEQSTQDLPDNDDFSTMKGCKKPSQIDRFYDRTAGILAMVKPCGMIVNWCEMFTCESASQVFTFILRTVTIQGGEQIKYLGYDRACELVPFLRNLQRNKNKGAELLLSAITFLVDLFHVSGHTTPSCQLMDPRCEFHPKLPRFNEIDNVNTQCAEQTFKWLDSYKFHVRRMTANKYKFFVYTIIKSRNMRTAKKLQKQV